MKAKLAAVVVLAAVGAGAVFVALGGLGTGQAATTEYLTAQATIGDVTDDIAATGTLEPTSRTAVAFGLAPWTFTDTATAPSSQTTWPVAVVAVAVGDTVAAGEVLATADPSDLQADLTRAKRDLTSAEVRLRAAEDAVDDAEATATLRQARIERNSARNAVDEAAASVADLTAAIAAATLTAPVAGVVSEVNLLAGSDAPTGAAVVIDATTFAVTTDVVESDLIEVATGQAATVTISALDVDVDGTVTAISPLATEGSSVVSYPVTVTLGETPDAARSGMSAEVTITIASAQDVLTIPSAALLGSDGDYRVRTLGTDGTPVITPVEVGLVTNTTAEITSGLAEGTAVITGTTADLAGTSTTGGFGGGGAVAIPGGGPVVRGEFGPAPGGD